MNILLYTWKSFMQPDMQAVLKNMGHSVTLFQSPIKDYLNDSVFEDLLRSYLQKGNYDFVFSFNYFPVISKVCSSVIPSIKYVSWFYDSPGLNSYSKTITNPCNYIFHFDSHACNELRTLGASHVYYLPLAVNTNRLDDIVYEENDLQAFSSVISFVGSLYDGKNFFDKINYLPPYLKGYLDGIMQAQKSVHGYNFLDEVLNDTIMSEIKKYVLYDMGNDLMLTDSFIFSSLFLGQKVTSMERIEILKLLSEFYPVDLYSDSQTTALPKVRNKGYADYIATMPKIFKLSKINLNISVRTIQSGIPLRIFDILGSGGFCITNYQEDLATCFEIGKDLVVYDSLEDLCEKVPYYLEHEDERLEIAGNGYEKVKNLHNFEERITTILEILTNEK